MGKTLLKGRIRLRKPRRSLPCKRFCSCCYESGIKPFPPQKSGRSLPNKRKTREFGKTASASKRASVKVKQSNNSLKSIALSQGCNVRARLKQLIVNVTRLSEDVLRVLLENGSICACNVSSDGLCKLSPSKAGTNSCLVTPTRRLRSTQIQPVVRQNVMDCMRELNADWRSTSCPLSVNVSSEAYNSDQEPGFSMKTLFLENLSIRKKTLGDESTKENVKMHQNENISSLGNPRLDTQQLKSPMISPSKVRINTFPMKVKRQIQYTGYHSLLWDRNPGKFQTVRQQNMNSLLRTQRLSSLPLTSPWKSGASVSGVPRTALRPHSSLSGPLKNDSSTKPSPTALRENFSISKIESQKNQEESNPSSLSPTKQKPHQSTSSKGPQKSKILVDLSENLNATQAAQKRTYAMRYSKNGPSTSDQCKSLSFNRCSNASSASELKSTTVSATKPRIIRGKRPLPMRPGYSDPSKTVYTNVSKPVDKSLLQEKSRGSSVTEKTAKVDDSCSSSKKQKVASSETSESSKLVRFSNPDSGKPEKSHVLPKNDQRIHTIVLSDSSDEGMSVQKAASAMPYTPARKKSAPIRRSARDKSKRQPIALLQKRKRASRSNASVASLSNAQKAVKRVPQRRNSLLKRNPKNVLSDPESEELSSDSEAEAPRYLSRTGRSVGTWTGCRSCPGCKIDRRRKENSKPKPGKRKRKPGPVLNVNSDGSESDFYTDVVHAGSEELVEDTSHALNPSPAVFIHGLTSSESSDDEVLVLKGGRTALVVVPNKDAGEHKSSPPRSEVVEEVTSSHAHSPVFCVTGSPVKPVLEPTTASEGRESVGPGVDSPAKFSESALPSTIARTKQLLDRKGSLKSSASATNRVPQTPENSQDLSDAISPAVIVNDVIVSDGAPSSQIPVNSKPHEAQNVKADLETDGFPKSPQSEVQCYLSHHDSDGTLLLHEIISDSSDEENNGLDFQDNENNVSLKDNLSVSLLVDSSLETSDNSSALVNFDSQEYTECESTCYSQAGSMPEDLQEVNVPPEGWSVESFNEGPSLRDKLCNPESFIEVDPPKREDFSKNSMISEDISKSPKRDGNPACVTLEGKVAECQMKEDLASEHGPAPSSGAEICTKTQSWLMSEESSLDVPQPKDMEQPGEDSTSKVRTSEFVDYIDHNNTNTCQHSPPDTTKSLADSAYQGSAPLSDFGPAPSKTALQENDSSLVLDTLQRIDLIDKVSACVRGTNGYQDSPRQELVGNVSQDNSASPTGTVVGKIQPSQRSNTVIPKVSNILLDSRGKSDPKSGTLIRNETSEAIDQDCQVNYADSKVLEILMLEGCPSCRKDCQNPTTYNQAPPEHSSSGDPPVGPLSPKDSSNCGVRQKQEGTFYHALSKVLVDCLNNVVESVKLDNREVIIKKVNPESPDAPETDPQEAGLAADDLTSILKEFNLPAYLNPRLTIKKLPSVPRTAISTCDINSTSGDSASQEPPTDDHQVPEHARPDLNTTPTKSLYERKGYPTPIKRLDPRVLSVIKYNDLEIYNDEPSMNDPPKSDRLECVTSKGIRLELNPEELANIENLLNTKISQFREEGVKKIGNVKSFELDELVIYNDEPSLNLTPTKRCKTHLPVIDIEDPEEFVIDNDAPPLNEPIGDAPIRNEHLEADIVSKPRLDDSECMVISSDDEIVANLPLKDSPEVDFTLQEASHKPSKLLERPRIKLFRKRRNSKNSVNTPSIIDLHTNQMAQNCEDPIDFGTGNLENLELSELDCLGNDVIDEIVIDDSGVETIPQSSWESLPPFQSYGEVLHQPQVFNHLGQPLLNLGSSSQFIERNMANPIASSSDGNAIRTPPVKFDLSEILHNSQETECLNISDSDTMTASECGDEVIVVSPTKPSLSHVERFIEMQTKRLDKSVVQNVDTDSDDDVIVMSDPIDDCSVNRLSQPLPSPAVTSRAHRVGLQAPGRPLALKTNASPQIRRNPSNQITSSHVRTVQTPSGHSYLVLVVPPNTAPVNLRR